MITIAISSDLAGEHAGFVAAMAERGHTVDVFAAHPDPGEEMRTAAQGRQDERTSGRPDRPCQDAHEPESQVRAASLPDHPLAGITRLRLAYGWDATPQRPAAAGCR